MITRKRRNDDNSNDDSNIFENPVAQVFEDVDHEDRTNPDNDDRYEKLAKQIADLQSSNAEMQRANMALLSNPNWNSTSENGGNSNNYTEIDINKIELPDPALDPDGFSHANLRRIEAQEQNRRNRENADARRREEIKEKVDGLWQDFTERFPEMADDQERIDFVSTAVVKQAMKRGINVDRYMFLTRDKFLEDVAQKYTEVFGEPSDDTDDDYEDTPRSRRASANSSTRARPRNRERAENEPMGRTGGIFGGTESGGRPSRSRSDDFENGPDLIDDLQAMQKKSGFF